MTVERKSWWATAYDRIREIGYYYHFIDFPSAQAEIPFMEEVLPIQSGASVLDLGCGNGRHAILLAQKEYRVTAVDFSTQALEMAANEAGRQGLDITFRRQDMRDMNEREAYDAVIMMDGSFGLFSDFENEDVLKRASRSLKSGGGILLNIFNPYYAAVHPELRHEMENEKEFIHRRSFEPYNGRVCDEIRCVDTTTGREQAVPPIFYRAYTLPELARMGSAHGLGNLKAYGHDRKYRPSADKPFEAEKCLLMYVVMRKI
ncbi:MAG: class I SAM-dependent methyltransferase [Bacillota bacterium]